jgi:hypothetical protein
VCKHEKGRSFLHLQQKEIKDKKEIKKENHLLANTMLRYHHSLWDSWGNSTTTTLKASETYVHAKQV